MGYGHDSWHDLHDLNLFWNRAQEDKLAIDVVRPRSSDEDASTRGLLVIAAAIGETASRNGPVELEWAADVGEFPITFN